MPHNAANQPFAPNEPTNWKVPPGTAKRGLDELAGRAQIGTYDALKKDKDGSVTLYIQNASPGKDKESNWLPAPKGAFNLAMRLYNPKTEARTLDWVTPGVKKVQ